MQTMYTEQAWSNLRGSYIFCHFLFACTCVKWCKYALTLPTEHNFGIGVSSDLNFLLGNKGWLTRLCYIQNHDSCIRGYIVLTVRYGHPLSANISAASGQEIQYGGPLPSGSTHLEARLECSCCGFQYVPHFPASYLDVLSQQMKTSSSTDICTVSYV